MMIRIQTFDHPISLNELIEVNRFYPVIYVFCHWWGVHETINRLLTEAEPGEIAVVTPFDPGGELWRRRGRNSTQAMIAFSLATPYDGADRPEQYAEVIEGARRWRRRNKQSEERNWPDSPWARQPGGSDTGPQA